MGMRFMMRPHPAGPSIASLQEGDEITIKAGAGEPAAEADTVDIIVMVHGMSALTAGGIKLMCADEGLVEPTGIRDEPGTYEISELAQEILAEVRV
jgi:hypothetical protein